MKNLLLIGVLLTASGMLLAEQPGLDKRVTITESKDGTREKIVTEYYTNSTLIRREVVSRKKGSTIPDAGYTKLFQGTKLVLDENWGPGPIRQRTFYRDGKMLMTETDKDGDGIFEWAVVYQEDGEACAVFKCSGKHLDLLGTNSVNAYNEGAEQAKVFFQALTNDAPSTNLPSLSNP